MNKAGPIPSSRVRPPNAVKRRAGNVTGAMVFQGTFPVSVGVLGTEWALAPSALATMVLAVAAAGFCLLQIIIGGHWRPWLLSASAIFRRRSTHSSYSRSSPAP